MVLEDKVSTTSKALEARFGATPRSRIALETGMHSLWPVRKLLIHRNRKTGSFGVHQTNDSETATN